MAVDGPYHDHTHVLAFQDYATCVGLGGLDWLSVIGSNHGDGDLAISSVIVDGQ